MIVSAMFPVMIQYSECSECAEYAECVGALCLLNSPLCFDGPSYETECLVFVRSQSTEDDPIARKLNVMCCLVDTQKSIL